VNPVPDEAALRPGPGTPRLVLGDEPGPEPVLAVDEEPAPLAGLSWPVAGRLAQRAPDPARLAAQRARRRRRAAQRRSARDLRLGSAALLGLLVLCGLTLLLLDLRSAGQAFAGPRSVVAAVLGPLQTGVERVEPGPDPQTQAELADLRARLAAPDADRARLAELEALFGLVSRTGHQVVAGTVVAVDRSGGQSATIDRGSDDGLARDQAVITGSGLAGRVVATTGGTAVVRFLSDAQSAVGARLPGTGEAGIVRGTGRPGVLEMELIDPVVEVAAGDPVVTYGSPGAAPFPPGLLIGTVLDPGDPASPRRIVTIGPAAPMSRADVLAVVVEPARTAPAPVVGAPAPPAGGTASADSAGLAPQSDRNDGSAP
jgi:rod shape-determining protein MreC